MSYHARAQERAAKRTADSQAKREGRLIVAHMLAGDYARAVEHGSLSYNAQTGLFKMSHDRIGKWSTKAQVKEAINKRYAAQHAAELGGDDAD